MSTCRDIEPLITASIDQEATKAERAEVGAVGVVLDRKFGVRSPCTC